MVAKKPKKAKKLPVVVYVDDHEELLKVMVRVLNIKGFKTIGFSDPDSALKYMGDNPVNTLVTDFEMPGTNGIKLAKAAMKKSKEINAVVFSGTAQGSKKLPVRCQWVNKISPIETLIAAINETL